MLPTQQRRYQIWTKARGEISVMALIFGYIFRYTVLLPRFGAIIPVRRRLPNVLNKKVIPIISYRFLGFSYHLFWR